MCIRDSTLTLIPLTTLTNITPISVSYTHLEDKALALKDSNKARLEILADLLETHLSLHCGAKENGFTYVPAYFLGTHEVC